MGDRRLKVLEIATEVGILYGSVLNTLHEHLGLSKVRATWVPCFSDTRSEVISGGTCSELLAIYSATPDDVLSRIITGDETWIHHWDSDTKQESIQRCSRSTSTLLHTGSSALNVGWKVSGHNFLGLERRAAGDWTILR